MEWRASRVQSVFNTSFSRITFLAGGNTKLTWIKATWLVHWNRGIYVFFLSKRPFSLSTLYVCFCVNIILFISSNLSWKFPSLRVCKFLARRKTGNACNFTCKVLLYRLIRGSFARQMTVNESSILNFSIFLRIHGYTHVFRIKIKVPFLYIMRI